MKARLIVRIKEAYGHGSVEGVVWEVPAPAQPSTHRIKYRLVYLVGGERVVGYDNERGKGDHKHIRGTQAAYAFKDVPTLIRDFLQDVQETES
ncbi:MAG: hypothetical protein HY017_21015 [Betaproteobacteria bacterium]|nr:hypothetical protein [Betaproteobacteria bacterium]